MITRLRGRLVRVLEDEARIEVGGFEFQVLVPELVRRSIQTRLDEEIALHTVAFLEGNPARGGKMSPRLIGFLSEAEIEFFDLFCTVDGVGVKTALKALVRSVRDVADMIQRQDAQMLAALPGISSSTAERIIAKLRKKVTKFALMVDRSTPGMQQDLEPNAMQDAFTALVSVGHSELDARQKLDRVLASGKKFKTAQEVLLAIYQEQ